jgi:ABC-type transport system involved in multi-copper enzyme maturation permease subunit
LSERVYILTKPIKKTSFLFSKFLSSFTICFAYILITMVFLFSVAACIYSTDMNFNIFNEKLCNVWGLFGSFICLGLFTCSFSLLFRYLFKPGLSAIFSVCLAALFLVIYSMFISIDANHPGPALWYTSITPSIVFFPLFLIVSAIGTYYFKNQEVAS